MIPEWVKKHKTPGTTIKAIGNNYYLYFATSSYDKNSQYPISHQTYIGKITEYGVVSERVSLNISNTIAKTLDELVDNIPKDFERIILINVKNEWLYTKITIEQRKELEKRGLYKDGKLII